MANDDPDQIARLLDAARVFVDHGLQTDDSAFTPGTPIWTAAHADDNAGRAAVDRLFAAGR